MSLAPSPRPRYRRPKLRVFAAEYQGRKRHICTWNQGGNAYHAPVYRSVEFWTEAEWAALTKWERGFFYAQWLPGVGYVSVQEITEEESSEIIANLNAEQEHWRSYGMAPSEGRDGTPAG
jgi:hypothetical protein